MLSTTIVSLATVAVFLLAGVDGHGQMLYPTNRQMSEKFHKDSGALINIGLNEMQIAPIEGLSQHKQKDFPPSPTFNLLNGCRGTVYEEGSNVTTLQPGKKFDVKWTIQAPHPGFMKLSILKPSEDSNGVITYKKYKTLLTIEPFAENGGDGSTTAKMPANVKGCKSPGDCVLQFYWHSDIADQTYPTCADIIVPGSGASTPSAPAAETPEAPTPATRAPKATTSKPSTAAPKAASPAPAPVTASTATKGQSQEIGGEAESGKCSRRMRRN
ncbi:Lytic polysaccharide mono-oxygenase [Phytophthora infestans]|uniref:Lytic polysaccharide mono-oxygenase n=1 Tax=Phytophthora infestans TaxID=4787 RepID=A0A8S9TP34_PHYIN|nr:Lytic polysaccharide mono-oxygenase [Phytophthora infestans]